MREELGAIAFRPGLRYDPRLLLCFGRRCPKCGFIEHHEETVLSTSGRLYVCPICRAHLGHPHSGVPHFHLRGD